MIPIPQYPLYSACITLFGGRLEGYYLDEDKGWEITTVELERAYKQSIDRGTKLKGLIVINPGNPTG
jgi:aspartate/methionine/tyrosine aminotransferase